MSMLANNELIQKYSLTLIKKKQQYSSPLFVMRPYNLKQSLEKKKISTSISIQVMCKL